MKGPTDMRRSIATVSLSGTLPEKIDAIAAAGFDGIELFEPDFTHFAGAAHDLRALCDERGLAIELFQPFRDFEGIALTERITKRCGPDGGFLKGVLRAHNISTDFDDRDYQSAVWDIVARKPK